MSIGDGLAVLGVWVWAAFMLHGRHGATGFVVAMTITAVFAGWW